MRFFKYNRCLSYKRWHYVKIGKVILNLTRILCDLLQIICNVCTQYRRDAFKRIQHRVLYTVLKPPEIRKDFCSESLLFPTSKDKVLLKFERVVDFTSRILFDSVNLNFINFAFNSNENSSYFQQPLNLYPRR